MYKVALSRNHFLKFTWNSFFSDFFYFEYTCHKIFLWSDRNLQRPFFSAEWLFHMIGTTIYIDFKCSNCHNPVASIKIGQGHTYKNSSMRLSRSCTPSLVTVFNSFKNYCTEMPVKTDRLTDIIKDTKSGTVATPPSSS